ncbi:MAG: PspA/IM30 family protein [Myxococcota bacterium]
MRLMQRMSSWLRAEGHGVVDAIEDRGLLLKQAVREAEIALDTKRAESESLKLRAKELAAVLDRARSEVENLDADVELALEQEQTDLARFAVRKLLPLRQRVKDTERSIEDIEERRVELDQMIASQTGELDELKVRVRDYLERSKESGGEVTFAAAVTDEDVELELLRRKRKQGGA